MDSRQRQRCISDSSAACIRGAACHRAQLSCRILFPERCQSRMPPNGRRLWLGIACSFGITQRGGSGLSAWCVWCCASSGVRLLVLHGAACIRGTACHRAQLSCRILFPERCQSRMPPNGRRLWLGIACSFGLSQRGGCGCPATSVWRCGTPCVGFVVFPVDALSRGPASPRA